MASIDIDIPEWGMRSQSQHCRAWHQAALRHDLFGVQAPRDWPALSTVNPVHLFACGDTPLGERDNAKTVLGWLLNNGGSLTACDAAGWLPINYAIWFGLFRTVDVLLEAGSPVHHPSTVGPQPLDTALAAVSHLGGQGVETTARLLLMNNADPMYGLASDPNYAGVSWLTWALQHEKWDWADLLWAKGARIVREKELHLLLLRGTKEALVWAQLHGIDVLHLLPPNHSAYPSVYGAQTEVERVNMLQSLEIVEEPYERVERKI